MVGAFTNSAVALISGYLSTSFNNKKDVPEKLESPKENDEKLQEENVNSSAEEKPVEYDQLGKLDYKVKENRRASFKVWPNAAVKVEDLVEAGFYYKPTGDKPDLVKCPYCLVEICNWELGDTPLGEHMKWSPNCPFIRSSSRGEDICGHEERFPAHAMPEKKVFSMLNSRFDYGEEKVRVESFEKGWPTAAKPKAEDLAAAGFYFRGSEDHTTCFSCGKSLSDWKQEDDPWEQHAYWYPDCDFVLRKKGPSFVQQVRQKLAPEAAATTETKEKDCASESKSGGESGVVRCTICDSNERSIVFLPCMHVLACSRCSERVESCPMCRKRIDSRMRVFVS